MSVIYKANAEALKNGWDWDTIFCHDAIEIVAEFDSYEEAVKAYEERHYDEDLYGVF